MPRQSYTELRARIPAAIAAATAATVERAARLLQDATQAIQARRMKSPPPAAPEKSGPQPGRDDTH
jgi:hypothetical protein